MKRTEVKRRLSLAVKALKGVPLIYDFPVPKLEVETQPIQTIRSRFEIARPEADMMPPEVVTKMAERKLTENLIKGLRQSGLVQVRETNTIHAIIYEAQIRAIPPIK